MTRLLYEWLIRLHPPQFRERFGGEMLCIFDEAGAHAQIPLLADCLVSAMRQWILRAGAWKWMAALMGALMHMTLAMVACQAMLQMIFAAPLSWRGAAPPDGMILLLDAGLATAIIMSGMVLAVSINSYGFGGLWRTSLRKQHKGGRNR